MKIAVTTAGTDLQAEVELRFGRAASFLIYDSETETFNLIDNQQQLNAEQGAGIQAAGQVINSGASALITGHCGPKAMKVLKSGSVKVYLAEKVSVLKSLKQFHEEKLEEISEADVEGHWV